MTENQDLPTEFLQDHRTHESRNFTWHSKGDIMVFWPEERKVERWRFTDDGMRCVEVWKMTNVP